MEPTVSLEYGPYTNTTSNAQGVCVYVTNEGESPIDSVKVEWSYEFEKPQPGQIVLESDAIDALEVARAYPFVLESLETDGPLAVGQKRMYVYPMEWLREMLSVASVLSPERYEVRISLNGKAETGIPGNVWGTFLQKTSDALGSTN